MSVIEVTRGSPLWSEIQSMRSSHAGDNPAGEMDYENSETYRDECSFHLAYFIDSAIAGSIRITPLGHGLTFSEKVVDVNQYFENPLKAIDANRLILTEAYRGTGILQDFLMQASSWVMKNTTFKSVSAICLKPLASLYTNIGGSILVDEINWEANGKKRQYSLISLELDAVYNTINRRKGNGSVLQRAG